MVCHGDRGDLIPVVTDGDKRDVAGPTGLNKFDENGDVTEKMQMVFIVHNGKFTSWVKDS